MWRTASIRDLGNGWQEGIPPYPLPLPPGFDRAFPVGSPYCWAATQRVALLTVLNWQRVDDPPGYDTGRRFWSSFDKPASFFQVWPEIMVPYANALQPLSDVPSK